MTFRAAAAAPRAASTASSRSAATCRRSSTPPRSPACATALVCRGARDEWYTDDEVRRTTSRRLREAGVARARRSTFDGGHEWSDDVVDAAAHVSSRARASRMIEIRSATSADARSAGRAAVGVPRRPDCRRPKTHDAFVERCAPWMRRELATATRGARGSRSHDGRIVGQVWLQTLSEDSQPGRRARAATRYLSNLYVKPSARGGIGTRLLEAALDWARANGIDRVVLWPSARSVHALPAPRLLARRRGHGAERHRAPARRWRAEPRRTPRPAPPDPCAAA